MANPIEPASQPPTNFVSNTSRYLNSDVIYWSEKRILTFETYKRKPQSTSRNDKFMIVTPGLQYRPDRIAEKAYGKNLIGYWWKILEANHIFDIYDLKVGATLRIPAII